MNRVIHVKITSDEPGRVTEFYRRAFNWKVTKFPDPPDGNIICLVEFGRS